MHNRLKAAWRVLFAEHYLVVTTMPTQHHTFILDIEHNQSLYQAHLTSRAAVARTTQMLQMNHLVAEANAVLGNKVN